MLKDPKHGVNPYQRMVVSYDVHRKEKREGYIDPGAVYTTISIYHYEWDEYNVTTAEQVGDKYFMFVNKLKYFLSGDATTPTGRWILSTRFPVEPDPRGEHRRVGGRPITVLTIP